MDDLITWLRNAIEDRQRWVRDHEGQYAPGTPEEHLVEAVARAAEADWQAVESLAGQLADDPDDEVVIWLLKVRAEAYATSPGYRKEWRR